MLEETSLPAGRDVSLWSGHSQTVLRGWVERLGITGSRAVVLYESDETVVKAISVPSAAGSAAACQAVRLALAESAPHDLSNHPHAIVPICADSCDRDSGSRFFVACTESDQRAQEAVEWLKGSGLRASGICPRSAVDVIGAAGIAISAASADGVVLGLCIGSGATAFAGVIGGRLALVRQVQFGTDRLVGALTRIMHASDGREIHLGPDAAARMLERIGIPEPDEDLDVAEGLTGRTILPLLQPVLQRFAVELKQTIRYGLGTGQGADLRLLVAGRGAVIPRLAESITARHGLDAQTAQDAEHAAVEIAWPSIAGLNLMPCCIVEARSARRWRRALWQGVALAAGVMAADTFSTRVTLADQRARLEGLADRAELSPEARDAVQREQALRESIGQARSLIADLVERVPAWDALLIALARRTPEDVRLTNIELTISDGAPRCLLSGVALAQDPPSNPGSLGTYLDALADVPIVADRQLGSTQRQEMDGVPTQRFEITLDVLPLPEPARLPETRLSWADPQEDGS